MALRELTNEQRADLVARLRRSEEEHQRDRAEVLRAVEDMRRAEAERRVIERLPWWARLLLRRG